MANPNTNPQLEQRRKDLDRQIEQLQEQIDAAGDDQATDDLEAQLDTLKDQRREVEDQSAQARQRQDQ